jgi:hypothetical protein
MMIASENQGEPQVIKRLLMAGLELEGECQMTGPCVCDQV